MTAAALAAQEKRRQQQHLESPRFEDLKTGIQYTPVDSIATVVIPTAVSHAAN